MRRGRDGGRPRAHKSRRSLDAPPSPVCTEGLGSFITPTQRRNTNARITSRKSAEAP
jgi:hypothetical protein